MNRRIKNKKIKNSVVVYDVCSIPKGLTLNEVARVKNMHGLILYNSEAGQKPFVLPKKNSSVFKFKNTK
jgi:hypothetical protein